MRDDSGDLSGEPSTFRETRSRVSAKLEARSSRHVRAHSVSGPTSPTHTIQSNDHSTGTFQRSKKLMSVLSKMRSVRSSSPGPGAGTMPIDADPIEIRRKRFDLDSDQLYPPYAVAPPEMKHPLSSIEPFPQRFERLDDPGSSVSVTSSDEERDDETDTGRYDTGTVSSYSRAETAPVLLQRSMSRHSTTTKGARSLFDYTSADRRISGLFNRDNDSDAHERVDRRDFGNQLSLGDGISGTASNESETDQPETQNRDEPPSSGSFTSDHGYSLRSDSRHSLDSIDSQASSEIVQPGSVYDTPHEPDLAWEDHQIEEALKGSESDDRSLHSTDSIATRGSNESSTSVPTHRTSYHVARIVEQLMIHQDSQTVTPNDAESDQHGETAALPHAPSEPHRTPSAERLVLAKSNSSGPIALHSPIMPATGRSEDHHNEINAQVGLIPDNNDLNASNDLPSAGEDIAMHSKSSTESIPVVADMQLSSLPGNHTSGDNENQDNSDSQHVDIVSSSDSHASFEDTYQNEGVTSVTSHVLKISDNDYGDIEVVHQTPPPRVYAVASIEKVDIPPMIIETPASAVAPWQKSEPLPRERVSFATSPTSCGLTDVLLCGEKKSRPAFTLNDPETVVPFGKSSDKQSVGIVDESEFGCGVLPFFLENAAEAKSITPQEMTTMSYVPDTDPSPKDPPPFETAESVHISESIPSVQASAYEEHPVPQEISFHSLSGELAASVGQVNVHSKVDIDTQPERQRQANSSCVTPPATDTRSEDCPTESKPDKDEIIVASARSDTSAPDAQVVNTARADESAVVRKDDDMNIEAKASIITLDDNVDPPGDVIVTAITEVSTSVFDTREAAMPKSPPTHGDLPQSDPSGDYHSISHSATTESNSTGIRNIEPRSQHDELRSLIDSVGEEDEVSVPSQSDAALATSPKNDHDEDLDTLEKSSTENRLCQDPQPSTSDKHAKELIPVSLSSSSYDGFSAASLKRELDDIGSPSSSRSNENIDIQDAAEDIDSIAADTSESIDAPDAVDEGAVYVEQEHFQQAQVDDEKARAESSRELAEKLQVLLWDDQSAASLSYSLATIEEIENGCLGLTKALQTQTELSTKNSECYLGSSTESDSISSAEFDEATAGEPSAPFTAPSDQDSFSHLEHAIKQKLSLIESIKDNSIRTRGSIASIGSRTRGSSDSYVPDGRVSHSKISPASLQKRSIDTSNIPISRSSNSFMRDSHVSVITKSSAVPRTEQNLPEGTTSISIDASNIPSSRTRKSFKKSLHVPVIAGAPDVLRTEQNLPEGTTSNSPSNRSSYSFMRDSHVPTMATKPPVALRVETDLPEGRTTISINASNVPSISSSNSFKGPLYAPAITKSSATRRENLSENTSSDNTRSDKSTAELRLQKKSGETSFASHRDELVARIKEFQERKTQGDQTPTILPTNVVPKKKEKPFVPSWASRSPQNEGEKVPLSKEPRPDPLKLASVDSTPTGNTTISPSLFWKQRSLLSTSSSEASSLAQQEQPGTSRLNRDARTEQLSPRRRKDKISRPGSFNPSLSIVPVKRSEVIHQKSIGDRHVSPSGGTSPVTRAPRIKKNVAQSYLEAISKKPCQPRSGQGFLQTLSMSSSAASLSIPEANDFSNRGQSHRNAHPEPTDVSAHSLSPKFNDSTEQTQGSRCKSSEPTTTAAKSWSPRTTGPTTKWVRGNAFTTQSSSPKNIDASERIRSSRDVVSEPTATIAQSTSRKINDSPDRIQSNRSVASEPTAAAMQSSNPESTDASEPTESSRFATVQSSSPRAIYASKWARGSATDAESSNTKSDGGFRQIQNIYNAGSESTAPSVQSSVYAAEQIRSSRRASTEPTATAAQLSNPEINDVSEQTQDSRSAGSEISATAVLSSIPGAFPDNTEIRGSHNATSRPTATASSTSSIGASERFHTGLGSGSDSTTTAVQSSPPRTMYATEQTQNNRITIAVAAQSTSARTNDASDRIQIARRSGTESTTTLPDGATESLSVDEISQTDRTSMAASRPMDSFPSRTLSRTTEPPETTLVPKASIEKVPLSPQSEFSSRRKNIQNEGKRDQVNEDCVPKSQSILASVKNASISWASHNYSGTASSFSPTMHRNQHFGVDCREDCSNGGRERLSSRSQMEERESAREISSIATQYESDAGISQNVTTSSEKNQSVDSSFSGGPISNSRSEPMASRRSTDGIHIPHDKEESTSGAVCVSQISTHSTFPGEVLFSQALGTKSESSAPREEDSSMHLAELAKVSSDHSPVNHSQASSVDINKLVSRIDRVVRRLILSGKLEVTGGEDSQRNAHKLRLRSNANELLQNLTVLRAKRISNAFPESISDVGLSDLLKASAASTAASRGAAPPVIDASSAESPNPRIVGYSQGTAAQNASSAPSGVSHGGVGSIHVPTRGVRPRTASSGTATSNRALILERRRNAAEAIQHKFAELSANEARKAKQKHVMDLQRNFEQRLKRTVQSHSSTAHGRRSAGESQRTKRTGSFPTPDSSFASFAADESFLDSEVTASSSRRLGLSPEGVSSASRRMKLPKPKPECATPRLTPRPTPRLSDVSLPPHRGIPDIPPRPNALEIPQTTTVSQRSELDEVQYLGTRSSSQSLTSSAPSGRCLPDADTARLGSTWRRWEPSETHITSALNRTSASSSSGDLSYDTGDIFDSASDASFRLERIESMIAELRSRRK